MSHRRKVWLCGLWVIVILGGWLVVYGGEREPDVQYVSTPPEVVTEMLNGANVGKDDIIYDLGCGDGRIVITAVEKFGAKKGVGIDIDAERIKESSENARKTTVGDRVAFLQQDLFDTDFSEATVVTLYLLPELNIRLRPALFRQLRPGDRIVSHAFDMEEWQPDKTVEVPGPDGEDTVFYWMLPGGAAGSWRWTLPGAEGEQNYRLRLRQRFQTIGGTMEIDGQPQQPIADARVMGNRLSFNVFPRDTGREKAKMSFTGRIMGNALSGSVESESGPAVVNRDWTAKRDRVNLVGAWRWTLNEAPATLRIQSRDGRRYATLAVGNRRIPLTQFYAWGSGVYFVVGRDIRQTYEGVAEGDRIVGMITDQSEVSRGWTAQRVTKTAAVGPGAG